MAPQVEPPADILTDVAASSEFVAAAIDLDSGATRWAIPRSDALTGVGLPIVDGERVMLPSGPCGANVMTSVDAGTGDTIWRSNADVPITDMGYRGPGEQIEIVGGIAVLRASAGDQPVLVGIDPATGEQKWTASAGQVAAESPSVVVVWVPESGAVRVLDRVTGSEMWTAPTTPEAPLTAAAADEAAVYLRTGAQLTALEALTGIPLWTVEVGPPQIQSPLARADDLLIGSSGADIVAFSAADGSERWRRPSTEPGAALFWFESMAVSDGNLYLTGTPTIIAVDLATGDTRWRAPDEWRSAALRATGSGRVLVQDEARLVHLLDAATGGELWSPPVSIAPEVDRAMAPTLSPDSLYVGILCDAVMGGSD
jgi:hypothetical protein